MTNVLVLGASGQIARYAVPMLAEQGDTLTLFARNAAKVGAPEGARVIEGDVLDAAALGAALQGQDVVYANLGGEIVAQAEALVSALDAAGVKRLIFIVSLGIYHELPEPFEAWNQQMIGDALVDYRKAADVIEASDLDYTIIRPAWLTNNDETDYELTQRDEQFKGTEVSRKAVAAFIASVVADPSTHSRANVGVSKPGTEGDKPAWY
ncbi:MULTISPECIES: NAD(P)H-binding protein [Kocuria]|uniref:NAD(P)H-binding protein n=1 Tax=Kocuria TaxID=57493 RepID=UPI00064D7FDD|nr:MULTISPECIES: NAD(P)H-binding protein [Kocuria]KMK72686.1 NAD-dependent dehydratase [Kocuria rhizophila]KUP27148.1 NAD-dependent dehydratase [Kocuria rhizophila]OFK05752.1 NAD-dependent dehydratase [Kocuria sp. HMSC066H03]PKZ37908.1 NAD-dependent dehydratase [Kocuria rhizophila]